MTETSLLEHFSLVRTQVIRLHGELLKPAAIDKPHQLKVEIKLTPNTLPHDNPASTEYQLGCRMHCLGHLPQQETDPLFQAEVLMNAIYRQMQGTPIPFEQFSREHARFNRQLYPLMRQWLMQMLRNLGIGNVHLPEDLYTATETQQESLNPGGPERTTRLH